MCMCAHVLICCRPYAGKYTGGIWVITICVCVTMLHTSTTTSGKMTRHGLTSWNAWSQLSSHAEMQGSFSKILYLYCKVLCCKCSKSLRYRSTIRGPSAWHPGKGRFGDSGGSRRPKPRPPITSEGGATKTLAPTPYHERPACQSLEMKAISARPGHRTQEF